MMVRNHSATSKINFEKPISPKIERNHHEKSKLIIRLQDNNNKTNHNNNSTIFKKNNHQSDLSLPPKENEKMRVKQGFKESIDLLNCKIKLKEGFGEEIPVERSFSYDYGEVYERFEEERDKERRIKNSRYYSIETTEKLIILRKIISNLNV